VEIQEHRHGAVTVVRPDGPLVQDDAERFRSRINDVLGRSLGRFVVDASAVPYVDSVGLEVLADLTQELGHSGQALKLCGATETVREILDLTELTTLFEHYEDVQTAVRNFL